MRRSTLLLWSSIALCSASLAPIWYAADVSAAGTPKSEPTAAAASAPNLHTVPEDGAEDDFPASSRLVRDIIAARPNEDLVICVAGCRPGTDRVIFAQPADPMARRTNIAAQPDAAAAASKPVTGNKDEAPTPAPAEATTSQSSEPAADSAAEAKPAEQETHMEPTAAEPEPSQDNTGESDTEMRSDESSDNPDQSREHHHEAEPDPPSGEPSE